MIIDPEQEAWVEAVDGFDSVLADLPRHRVVNSDPGDRDRGTIEHRGVRCAARSARDPERQPAAVGGKSQRVADEIRRNRITGQVQEAIGPRCSSDAHDPVLGVEERFMHRRQDGDKRSRGTVESACPSTHIEEETIREVGRAMRGGRLHRPRRVPRPAADADQ
jgi:hypothetical protein